MTDGSRGGAGLLYVVYAKLSCSEEHVVFIHSLLFAEIWYEEAREEHKDSDLCQNYWLKFGTES